MGLKIRNFLSDFKLNCKFLIIDSWLSLAFLGFLGLPWPIALDNKWPGFFDTIENSFSRRPIDCLLCLLFKVEFVFLFARKLSKMFLS